ncbi:MAG: AraC family transcriptional regulator [Bacillota bacterium]|jgi:AraC-like DNA-binding protein|nr:AraC family transcriptional regulator [Bacillota bacterium]
MYEEKIPWIDGTPLGIKVRKIELVPTHMHENILEIVFCLKGSIKFAYGYEEFTLMEGEFISVDKDAHFLQQENEDNVCISFYLNLEWFVSQHPYITGLLFVCEATKQSARPYPSYYHKQLKGILLSFLFYLSKQKCLAGSVAGSDPGMLIRGAAQVIEIFIQHFDIVFYYNPDLRLKSEMMERNRHMMVYLQKHATEKLTLELIAKKFNLSKAYVSEFLSMFEVGFRKSLSYIRANHSEKLLLETDLNIMDISEACGFSDPKYYYRAFKEWYKCTPRQFRVRYRDKMAADSKEEELDLTEVDDSLNEMMQKHYLELFLQ